MDDKKEILKALEALKEDMHSMNNELKDEIFSLKEEMLLNRDDIYYVKKLRDVITVDDIVSISKDIDTLKSQRDKAIAVLGFLYLLYSFALWYIGKTFF